MRIYISADLEGVAGISHPDEANPDKSEVAYFREQMTREVAAACEGAIEAGAEQILVKDAHWTARNIDPRKLPTCVSVLRGWSGHPYLMLAELDATFDAVVFIGYHSPAGSGANPLAHTLNGSVVSELRINGAPASEFRINVYTATYVGVPVAFVAGDAGLCQEVLTYDQHIETFATLRGIGNATVSVHPDAAVDAIRDGVRRALSPPYPRSAMRPLPLRFEVQLDYVRPREAFARSFYPRARLLSDRTVGFETDDYFEVLRFLKFCI